MDQGNRDGRQWGVCFGPYEADFATGELRKLGLRIKIQEKPLRLLQALVERPGELVTREELRECVWPSDVFVDFDRNLKIALNKLRTALADSAETPRYVETLPRRGYRFIAAVEEIKPNGSQGNGAPSAAAVVAPGFSPAPAGLKAAATTSVEKPQRPKANTGLQRHRPWAAAALALALLAGGVIFWRAIHSPAAAALAFHRRDWVLVSRFENRTGDKVLDGTVDFAVAQELSNSRFVGVVPAERIGDDLRLMEKPRATPLTPAIALQICQRDGGIRALITGRVEKIGNTFVLSAGIVSPATGVQVAGVEAQAANLNGILPAVRNLSNQLRAALGEDLSSIQASNLKLEKATTPSLRALQLYSQAMVLAYADPTDKPIPFLEQAVIEDPNFAAAHNLLAWCYSNIGKWNLAAPHFQKAFELASTVSERERLFILGSYYGHFKAEHEGVKGDAEKAFRAYEVLVRLYPDDFWGANNLSYMLRRKGRVEESFEVIEHLAELRPADFVSNCEAWRLAADMGRRTEAQRYLARTKRLLSPEVEKAYPYVAIDIETADAFSAERSWDMRATLEDTQRLAATYGAKTGRMRNEVAFEVGAFYLDLGKLRAAKEWFQKIPPGSPDGKLAAMALAEERGTAALKKFLRKQLPLKGPPFWYGTVMRLAQCGMLKESRQLLSQLKKRYGNPPIPTKYAEGGLALYEGHREQAIQLLKDDLKGSQPVPYAPWTEYVADLLATAYEQRGRVEEAIRVLQPLEDKHALDVTRSFHLFQLYEEAGDARDAQQVRANLLRRLAYADSDHPILVQLRKPLKLRAALAAKP